jgi:predicted MPP superfamily phosphohydrolase
MNIFVKWTLMFLAAQAILTAVQLLLRKKEIKPAIRVVLIIVKALLAIAFAVLPMAGPVQLRPVQPLMMALYAVLLMDAVADTVYSIICAVSKKERKFSVSKAISLALGVLFFVYGTVNMQVVLPNYHTYTSDKLTSEHKIIFAADIHVGSAQPFSVLEKEVKAMTDEKPECIILGGDITDDYTTKEEMEKTFELFGSCGVPVYYLYGNHDRQKHAEYANGMQFTADELEQTITKNGVIVLKDEFADIAPDLLLLGREDISEGGEREKAETLANLSSEKYLIVADHQPFEFKENLVVGTDLQLSGHTHAGQLFPLRAMYSVIGYAYGDFKEGDALMNVSAGACGWRVPFRTEKHCYYEVITLQPEHVNN